MCDNTCDISIVVPVYNCSAYIEKCVNTLLTQDIDRYEIVLVDDGSTDNTGLICDYFASRYSNVKVIHQDNKGVGGARNTGINASCGKYILFVDSDDYVSENCLGRMLNLSEENNLDILIVSRQIVCENEDAIIDLDVNFDPIVNINCVIDGITYLRDGLSTKEYYSIITFKMYRRSFLNDIGLVFETGIIHEDEAFSFLSTIKANRIMIIPEKYYYYRMNSNSIMHNLNLTMEGKSIKNAISHIADIIEVLGDDWENKPETELVSVYVQKLAKVSIVRFMQARHNEQIKARSVYRNYLDKRKRYYNLLPLSLKICSHDPFICVPFYKIYKWWKSLKSKSF